MLQRFLNIRNSDRFRARVGFWTTLTLVSAYFLIWFVLATNVPYADDVGRLFGFLETLDQQESLAEKVEYTATHQTNEHRIVVLRTLMLLSINVIGYVNLKHLMFMGSVALVGTFVIFFFAAKRTWAGNLSSVEATEDAVENSDDSFTLLYYLLPVTLLLFVPLHDVSDWALNMSTNLVYFFVFASLLLLSKSTARFAWYPVSILFAVLATFTCGAGMFVFFAGIVLLIFPRWQPRKMVAWSVIGALVIAVYFYKLQIPDHRPGVIENVTSSMPNIVLFFFAFCGAAFKDLFHSPFPQALIGLCIVVLLLKLCRKHFGLLRAQPLLPAMLCYLLLLFVPTSISRGFAGIDEANTDRYQIIPAMFVGIIYLIVMYVHPAWIKRYFPAILAFSLLLFVSRLSYNLPAMSQHSDELNAGLLDYHLGERSPSDEIPWLNPRIMNHVIQRGYYQSPAPEIWTIPETAPLELPTEPTPIVARFLRFADADDWAHAFGYAMFEGTRSTHPLKYLLLTSQETDQSYIVEANVVSNYSYGELEQMNKAEERFYNDDVAGFLVVINKRELHVPPGTYRVGVYLKENSLVGFRYLEECIEMPATDSTKATEGSPRKSAPLKRKKRKGGQEQPGGTGQTEAA